MEGFIKQEARARDLKGPTSSWNLTRWHILLRFGLSSYSLTESTHLDQFDDLSADSAKSTVPRQFMAVELLSSFWSSTDFLPLYLRLRPNDSCSFLRGWAGNGPISHKAFMLGTGMLSDRTTQCGVLDSPFGVLIYSTVTPITSRMLFDRTPCCVGVLYSLRRQYCTSAWQAFKVQPP